MKIGGIDIGGTYIKMGRIKKFPEVEDFKLIPTNKENLIFQIVKIIEELGVEKVGIGVPGLVDGGEIIYSPNLHQLNGVKLKKELKKRIKIPFIIENDANLVAVGEWKYGEGKGMKNVVVITLGTGVGGGLILGGQLYKGKGFAGEVGHIIIDKNGPPCGCGGYGCLESFVGNKAIERRAIEGIKKGRKTTLAKYKKLTPKIIAEEAKKGDKYAHEIIKETAKYIGIGIGTIINVLSPECIIIGGGIAKAGGILIKEVEKETKKYTYGRKEVKILKTKLEDWAGIVGGGELVRKEK
jgi:glucokinase